MSRERRWRPSEVTLADVGDCTRAGPTGSVRRRGDRTLFGVAGDRRLRTVVARREDRWSVRSFDPRSPLSRPESWVDRGSPGARCGPKIDGRRHTGKLGYEDPIAWVMEDRLLRVVAPRSGCWERTGEGWRPGWAAEPQRDACARKPHHDDSDQTRPHGTSIARRRMPSSIAKPEVTFAHARGRDPAVIRETAARWC